MLLSGLGGDLKRSNTKEFYPKTAITNLEHKVFTRGFFKHKVLLVCIASVFALVIQLAVEQSLCEIGVAQRLGRDLVIERDVLVACL